MNSADDQPPDAPPSLFDDNHGNSTSGSTISEDDRSRASSPASTAPGADDSASLLDDDDGGGKEEAAAAVSWVQQATASASTSSGGGASSSRGGGSASGDMHLLKEILHDNEREKGVAVDAGREFDAGFDDDHGVGVIPEETEDEEEEDDDEDDEDEVEEEEEEEVKESESKFVAVEEGEKAEPREPTYVADSLFDAGDETNSGEDDEEKEKEAEKAAEQASNEDGQDSQAAENQPAENAAAPSEEEKDQAEVEQPSQQEQEQDQEGDLQQQQQQQQEEQPKPSKKKQKKKATKKKQQKKPPRKEPPLRPVGPPWSRASANSFARPPPPLHQQQQHQQPLLSDRSASLATAGGGSNSSGLSAKALREKFRPVSNEEKVAQRLGELDSLLARDYAKEARLAYQRSVAECRQAWQTYVSTSRIMGDAPAEQHQQHHQSEAPRSRVGDNANNDEAATARLESDRDRHYPLGSRVAPDVTEQRHDQQQQQQQQTDEDAGRQLHGYRVGAPERGVASGRFGSDHRLSESSNPDVRAWLREKNRATRRERRELRDAKRRDMQAKLDAQQRWSDRQLMAEESYHQWVSRKERQDATTSGGGGGSSKQQQTKQQKSAQEQQQPPLPLADQEAAFAELENRRPRPPGPKPVHNSVFKRASSAVAANGGGASFAGRQVRMGVIGRHLETSASTGGAISTGGTLAIEQKQQQPQPRVSYDDWLQRKAAQQAAERRRRDEAERLRREAAAAADPQMSSLVPQLARRRIRTATESKQRRVDSGLGLSRPRTAVPSLASAATPPKASSSARHHRSARADSLERREAAISPAELAAAPNPFVLPADDVMLDRMLLREG